MSRIGYIFDRPSQQRMKLATARQHLTQVVQDMYVGDRVSDKLEPIHNRIYCQR